MDIRAGLIVGVLKVLADSEVLRLEHVLVERLGHHVFVVVRCCLGKDKRVDLLADHAVENEVAFDLIAGSHTRHCVAGFTRGCLVKETHSVVDLCQVNAFDDFIVGQRFRSKPLRSFSGLASFCAGRIRTKQFQVVAVRSFCGCCDRATIVRSRTLLESRVQTNRELAGHLIFETGVSITWRVFLHQVSSSIRRMTVPVAPVPDVPPTFAAEYRRPVP